MWSSTMNHQQKRPFAGQLMTCVVCGVQLRSHPEAETNWRCLEIDDEIFHACPDEFPPDNSSKEGFAIAYQAVIACCVSAMMVKAGKEPVVEVEQYKVSRRKQSNGKPKTKGFG